MPLLSYFSHLEKRATSAFSHLRHPPSLQQLRQRPPLLLISVIKATLALCLLHVLTFTDRYASSSSFPRFSSLNSPNTQIRQSQCAPDYVQWSRAGCRRGVPGRQYGQVFSGCYSRNGGIGDWSARLRDFRVAQYVSPSTPCPSERTADPACHYLLSIFLPAFFSPFPSPLLLTY